jgi:hypothetical protein
MTVMLDINVLLDVFLVRQPHYDCSMPRNITHFVGSPVPAITPADFLCMVPL